jgi:uracil-DNA glycosylase
MSLEEQRAALEAIAQEIRTCQKCPLYSGRTNAVPGT